MNRNGGAFCRSIRYTQNMERRQAIAIYLGLFAAWVLGLVEMFSEQTDRTLISAYLIVFGMAALYVNRVVRPHLRRK